VQFIEGDLLHPAANRALMAAGTPLTDEDRAPWLAACRTALTGGGVLTCSALKAAYRAALGPGVRFIWLCAPEALLRARLETRAGHFFPPALLSSQLETLEPPGPEALRLDAALPLSTLLEEAAAWASR
jgi:carbohydrate kinase (thermoresistant glucokinase family)